MGQRLDDFKALMDERDRRYAAELSSVRDILDSKVDAIREAIGKAEQAQLGVNATQNEFRLQLKDQASELMPRKETESLVTELRGRIEALTLQAGQRAGASVEGRYVYERLVAIVAVLVAVAAIWWRSY